MFRTKKLLHYFLSLQVLLVSGLFHLHAQVDLSLQTENTPEQVQYIQERLSESHPAGQIRSEEAEHPLRINLPLLENEEEEDDRLVAPRPLSGPGSNPAALTESRLPSFFAVTGASTCLYRCVVSARTVRYILFEVYRL